MAKPLNRSTLFLVLLGSLVGGRTATAQVLHGQVVDSITALPVTGAFATLLDSAGVELARALTGQDGTFLLKAPAPGVYRVQTKRIGFRAIVSDTIRLAAGQTVRYRLVTRALPISLPTVVVKGKPRCGDYGAAGSLTARLWTEAREALRAVSWTSKQPDWQYRLSLYDRDLDDRGRKVLAERTHEASGYYREPFATVSPGELAEQGYVVGDDPGHRIFRAPDAEVLLSTTFMQTHCFGLTNSHDDSTVVGLDFRPQSRGKITDVSGVLWLDRHTAALRSLDFTYENLSSELPKGVLGGHMDFMQLPSGPWIVGQWWIKTARMAIVQWPGGRRDWKVEGYLQTGGRIVQLTSAQGALAYDAARAVLRGVVFDSTRPGPLRNATVTLVGTRYETTTNARGEFDLDAATEGEYQVTFSAPRLDSLGFRPKPVAVRLAQGHEADVHLTVPGEATIAGSLCPDTAGRGAGRVLIGAVTRGTTGRPVAGAQVIVAWTDSTGRGGIGSGERRLRAAAGPTGEYVACGVPVGRWVAVLASDSAGRAAAAFRFTSQGLWDGPERYASFTGLIWTENLALAADSGATVHGLVVDSISKKPLAGVVVRVAGLEGAVLTRGDGTFALHGLPAGQLVLTMHRIGSGSGAAAVSLRPGADADAGTLALSPLAVLLPAATVEAQASEEQHMLDLVGFTMRRKAGFGDFITRQEFEKYTPVTVHDVLRRMPGVSIRPNPNYGRPAAGGGVRGSSAEVDYRKYIVEFRRTGGAAGRIPGSQACPVQFYLNGAHIGNDNDVEIDDIIAENQIEAIEAYVGLDVPQEFSSAGSECGVVVFWTRR